LEKLKEWEKENRQTLDFFAQNLKEKIAETKKKLEQLTDAYLIEGLGFAKYQ